ncbi:MAG: alpha-ketoglutarate-dependent dioxygenase AlkB [Vicinamibacterales bacterium]
MSLFEPDLPDGFDYREDFISREEEAELIRHIEAIEFALFEMRGVVAKRRVAFYGQSYDEGPAGPIPEFLSSLRARCAEWAGVEAEAFAMALINEYHPGAPIGWHRDAPQYGMVAGVSLLSACRMKLRPYVSPSELAKSANRAPRKTTHELTLAPRSAYLITGVARGDFEHSIPAVDALRYSITFRTLRKKTSRAR